MPPSDITLLLDRVAGGDRGAVSELWERVYPEVHGLAERAMAREAPGQTLQSTALANEVYLRLFGRGRPSWENRRHFFGTVARAVRRILVDRARLLRAGRAELDPGSLPDVRTRDGEGLGEEPGLDPEALERALAQLESDPRQARRWEILNLRYFAGRTVDETARLVGLSPGAVKREARLGRAWLLRAMKRGGRP